MWKWFWWAIFISLVAIALVLSFIFYRDNSYERFNLTGENCEHYYAKCVCFGSFSVRESYPPIYECLSREYCWDEDYVKCR